MGIIIYPYEIKTKVSTMNRNLDRLNLSIVSQKMRLKSATSSTTKALLMGQAWDTVMNYVDSVQLPLLETYSLWIREQKAANNKFGTEAGILPRVSELNEDQLNNQLRYWERRLDREYDREHPRSSVIRRCKSMIRDIRSKLLSMERFVHATEGIYDGATQVLAILQTAQNQLNWVTYDQKEHKIHFGEISNDWLLELNSAAARSYLLTNGVTETEIKNLDDMGFAPEVIRASMEKLSQREKRLLINSLQGIMVDSDWEAIANVLEKESLDEIQYQGLVNLISTLNTEDLEKIANLSYISNKETKWNIFDKKLSPVFIEIANRYCTITEKVVQETVLNEKYKLDYDFESIRKQMTKATVLKLILSMETVEPLMAIGDRHVKLIEGGEGAAYAYRLDLNRSDKNKLFTSDAIDVIQKGLSGMGDIPQLTYRIYEWGDAVQQENNLDEYVKMSLQALKKSNSDIAKSDINSYLMSMGIDKMAAGGIASSVVGTSKNLYDNVIQSAIIDGASDAVDIGNYLVALNISCGAVTTDGFATNGIELIYPKTDNKELLIRFTAYSEDGHEQVDVMSIFRNSDKLDDYINWYKNGGSVKTHELQEKLEIARSKYALEHAEFAEIGVKDMSQKQIQELINKVNDNKYKINDYIMEMEP